MAFERVNIYMLALIESCVPRETQAAVKDMKRPEAQIHSSCDQCQTIIDESMCLMCKTRDAGSTTKDKQA